MTDTPTTTEGQARALALISTQPTGRCTPQQLALELELTGRELGGLLRSLLQRDLVREVPATYYVTPAGYAALGQAVPPAPASGNSMTGCIADPEARPLPAQRHSQPSVEAAYGTAAKRRRHDHRRIAAALSRGPKTDRALQRELELAGSTERPRRIELVRAGIVVEAGYELAERTGRRSTLWAIAPDLTLDELEQRLTDLRRAAKLATP